MKYDKLGYQKTLIPNKPMFAFCGIGDPQSFIDSAKKLSLKIEGTRFIRDHQDYTTSVIRELSNQIKANDISYVVTTEKDIVKLPSSFLSEFETYVIKIRIKFENTLDLIILNCIVLSPLFN